MQKQSILARNIAKDSLFRCPLPIFLLFLILLTAPLYAANSGPASPAEAVLPSVSTTPRVIVVGFMGGFVARNAADHPEIQMMDGLRREYPKEVYFGLFENRRVGEAYKAILSQLRVKAGARLSKGALPDERKSQACILLFGHSWGAAAVVRLSRRLARAGIPVKLTVQVDSVTKPFQDDQIIPSNVLNAVNFYQTRGLIHGRSRIVAADPARTTILGNFRWEHRPSTDACREFSWYARVFTRSHIEIECDPTLWTQVKTLLRDSLPDPATTSSD